MGRTRLIWRIAFSFIAITLPIFLGVSAYLSHLAWQYQVSSRIQLLRGQARLIAEFLDKNDGVHEQNTLGALLRTWAESTGSKIVVLSPGGEVLASSDALPEPDQEAVRAAFHAFAADPASKYSWIEHGTAFVSAPIGLASGQEGVVLVAAPLSRGQFALLWTHLAIGTCAAAVVSLLGSFIVSRRLNASFSAMQARAERLAAGTILDSAPVEDIGEFYSLAELLNRTGFLLNRRIQELAQQKNELDAVLSSMVEGVMAIDNNERVLSLNAAAARMFGIPTGEGIGRSVQELIRNTDLHRFIAMTLRSGEELEDDISLYADRERVVQVRGTALNDASGKQIGCVIALNEVTRLKKLENAQREFVANVSHELKTPLTSIKGYVSTLIEDGFESPDDAGRFLEIISRQADNLDALIEDLLALSRLEQDASERELPEEEVSLCEVVAAAIQVCSDKAREKNIQLTVDCGPEIRAKLNARLLERAVVNLLDNSIKYSNEGGRVELRGEQRNGTVSLHVQDFGTGIEKEHLPRLFERFFRVDRARSRKLGGTGLGLAIVKHIMRVHGGEATVDSTPGKGSTFSIHLPVS
jgi:two-component system phosphate regulon sensor histidine kinase PhoR